MRLVTVFAAFAFATMMIASPVLADAKSDSEALYRAILPPATELIRLIGETDDPAATADRVDALVLEPIDEAGQRWMDAAFNSGAPSDPFKPFGGCLDATFALRDFSVKVVRYLRQDDKQPFTSADADPFRAALTRCEAALGVESTFADQ